MEPSESPTLIQHILRISRPWALGLSLLTYALGGGVAHYLGTSLDWGRYLGGQLLVFILLLCGFFLFETFELPPESVSSADGEKPRRLTRSQALRISLILLTGGAACTALWIAQQSLTIVALLILGLSVLVMLALSVPPFRLANSAYRDLLWGILFVNLIPAFAFALQSGELHTLLGYLTLPLIFLYLSCSLALSLEHYASDLKQGRRNMLNRLGWERAVGLHHYLLLVGFLLFPLGSLMGIPRSLLFPGLLGLPVGLFQIWQLMRIVSGAPPRWRLLMITAAATLVVTLYDLNLALWTD